MMNVRRTEVKRHLRDELNQLNIRNAMPARSYRIQAGALIADRTYLYPHIYVYLC